MGQGPEGFSPLFSMWIKGRKMGSKESHDFFSPLTGDKRALFPFLLTGNKRA